MQTKPSCVIALGYFDSVHLGHKKIIECAAFAAWRLSVKSVVFTFDGEPGKKQDGGSVLTTAERKSVICGELGADELLIVKPDSEFMATDKTRFLEFLDEKYDILGYVCGFDYTFGCGASGNAAFLESYAIAHGRFTEIIGEVTAGGEKISTTRVKRLLADGEVEKANLLLTVPYFVTGKVEHERGVGRQIGFPTVNVFPESDKFPLKNGVYAGHITVNGKRYKTITNYGSRPTFGLDKRVVEAHIDGFDGDLYGQTVTLYFDRYLREIIKFDNVSELVLQLKKDIGAIR